MAVSFNWTCTRENIVSKTEWCALGGKILQGCPILPRLRTKGNMPLGIEVTCVTWWPVASTRAARGEGGKNSPLFTVEVQISTMLLQLKKSATEFATKVSSVGLY